MGTSESTSHSTARSFPKIVLKSGIELSYEVRGEGPPILLIMGIAAQMIHWPDGFCQRLVDAGFTVIRYDHRDIGESTWLDHLPAPSIGPVLARGFFGRSVPAPYGLEELAHDGVELLDALGYADAHVVGVSMGAMVAQTMAIIAPHKMRSLTSMMSTTGEPNLFITHPRALGSLLTRGPRNRDEAVEGAMSFFRAVRSTGFSFDEDATRLRAGVAYDRGFHPRGFLRHFAAIGATGDRTARLRFVRVPTLVLHGSADPLIRPIGGHMTARAIKGAKLHIIDGLGHDFPEGAWPALIDPIVAQARLIDSSRRR